jgi:hypothetical protein
MAKFGGDVETLRVGASTRAINLKQTTSDPLVGVLSVAEARDRLVDALARLPDLDHPDRSLVPTGARALGPGADPRERWFLELDHEPWDGSTVRPRLPIGVASDRDDVPERAADLPLVPMKLDPLTVSDDAGFDEQIEKQPNLPTGVRSELPRLYGR